MYIYNIPLVVVLILQYKLFLPIHLLQILSHSNALVKMETRIMAIN